MYSLTENSFSTSIAEFHLSGNAKSHWKARKFWPGPMTLILSRSDLADDILTGGQSNVGLRVPEQPVALALLKEFEKIGGSGVAAPSANRFGAVSPTTANAVKDELENFLSKEDATQEYFLSDRLGSKIKIQKSEFGKGKIIIQFKSEADLQRLISLLKD